MGCNCKWLEIIVALVVFVVVVWPGLLGTVVSMWLAAVAAIVLLVHALMCPNCGKCDAGMMNSGMPKMSGRRRSRRRR